MEFLAMRKVVFRPVPPVFPRELNLASYYLKEGDRIP
jgi:hypothetical protein|uniref:Uncharacterized protein n=1 Tax=Picea glauca TaxID=3330 RepID=A0A117NG55_PICGL|nr:hypothetical protein ABT39_MTgene4060 [Picea glauca]KUM46265.1 hypothetical protein ABT39_MTgene1771 [Picea glauca]